MTMHNESEKKNNNKIHKKHKKYNISCFNEKQIINNEKKDDALINNEKKDDVLINNEKKDNVLINNKKKDDALINNEKNIKLNYNGCVCVIL